MLLPLPARVCGLPACSLLLAAVLALGGCGGGGGGDAGSASVQEPASSTPTFEVGGSVSGLMSGEALTLRNNGGDPLTLTANGDFVFGWRVTGAYDVTVGTAPAWHKCTVTRGRGTASADVADVAVSCGSSAVTTTVMSGLDWVTSVAYDSAGTLYAAQMSPDRIVMINAAGMVGVLAQASDGVMDPKGMILAPDGALYVANDGRNNILRIAPGGAVSVYAGSAAGTAGGANGNGTNASFNRPYGVAMDGAGNLYVAEYQGHRIRRISPTRDVTTVAGSGVAGFAEGNGTAAAFNQPSSIAIDAAGNLLVTDVNNHRIRKITPAGDVTTFAGTGDPTGIDGPATTATFRAPFSSLMGPDGFLYVGEVSGYRVRRISPGGYVMTLAGSPSNAWGYVDGDATTALFNQPFGLAFDPSGRLIVADIFNNAVRRIDR